MLVSPISGAWLCVGKQFRNASLLNLKPLKNAGHTGKLWPMKYEEASFFEGVTSTFDDLQK